MAELELEGCTLGQKHQHFNRLVQDGITKKTQVKVEDFKSNDSDIANLLKIDIASHNENLEYILKMLTCNNMLYVSRAIKQSNWLINSQNYVHIVNPEYFQNNLFPQMCTKAIIKLVKHIRNILKDQKRAEQFYYFEKNSEEAVKWLPCCSLEMVLENLPNNIEHIKTTLLRRLCEKSIAVLEIYMKNMKQTHKKSEALQATMFLLSSNTDKFLDLVEANDFPNFNKKATTILMKKCANRVIDNFNKYYDFIHLPTFVSCLKADTIKDFLLNQVQYFNQNKYNHFRFYNIKRLLLFIRSMPQEIRFEFVKEVFIDKSHEGKDVSVLSEKEKAGAMLCTIFLHRFKNYMWYQFAPFNVALQKVQELRGTMSLTTDEVSLLEVALISAQNKLSNEHIFLEFLRDNKNNIENKVMEEILIKLILKNNFINYDNNTWNVLHDIFEHIDIYSKSKNSEHTFINAIILYNVIHKIKVSEIVENKFEFNSMLAYHKKLSENEKEIAFNYLYDMIVTKHTGCKPSNEKDFQESVNKLRQTLSLLKDYNKYLGNYPVIIGIFKDLIKEKNKHSWTISMEPLFNIDKTWRKLLFDESLALCQSETVILNALKHDPLLLEKNENIVRDMLCNDKISLRKALSKIKIYWLSTFARNITSMYMEKLNTLGCHNATTRGLSILLPLTPLQELINKYIPKEAKIDWAKIDEIELSVQKQFAKNMHVSRPQPAPEIILDFAKGDYLQYALPSLFSIFYNLNHVDSQKHIPSLLTAPVSLQKHGIRLAVSRFKHEQVLLHFSRIWNNNKNASIRSVIFKTIYDILCKEKDSNKIKKTWELLEIFIDNLTFEEDKAIYKLLFAIDKVPLEIRGLFYMKSYKFLQQLLKSGDQYKEYEYNFTTTFTAHSKNLIEQLQPDFVVAIIQEFIADEFTKNKTEIWSRGCVFNIISSYLLCTTEEQTQLKRYEEVLLPILKECFVLWNSEDFIKHNLANLLNTLRCDIKQYVIDKKKVNPTKMFSLLQDELYRSLDISANYMLLTKWKLTVTFVSVLYSNKPISDWEEMCTKVANEFGNKCVDYLRDDCNRYFPRIYILFVKSLTSMLNDFVTDSPYLSISRSLLRDKTFVQGYLAAITLMANTHLRGPKQERDEKKRIFQELCKNICEHQSLEIKIHYYNQIKENK